MAHPIRASDQGVLVDVLVVPNASRSEVVGLLGDRVKVKVASPPHKGMANQAVIDTVREATGVKRITVVAGRTTRFKTLQLADASLPAVEEALSARS
ncbi:MAG: DUF167 family protein [Acidimicrobiia bacterium]|nr:DUF167 family protein [Acidimicrobiia bacterium]